VRQRKQAVWRLFLLLTIRLPRNSGLAIILTDTKGFHPFRRLCTETRPFVPGRERPVGSPSGSRADLHSPWQTRAKQEHKVDPTMEVRRGLAPTDDEELETATFGAAKISLIGVVRCTFSIAA
jgi:hypothetical protein